MSKHNSYKSHRGNFHDVGMFHDKFKLDNVTYNLPGPRTVSKELIAFRIKFLQEELNELMEATSILTVDGTDDVVIDHAKAFDALIDLVYVAHGTAHMLGYPWHEGWDLVQEANMQKQRALRPEQSARGSIWDVIKPEGWKAPDIAGLLRRWGWNL